MRECRRYNWKEGLDLTKTKAAQGGYSKDMILLLAACFFYMSGPMLVTPLIVGFSRELGASVAVISIIGGLMNLCSLVCRPLVGNLADRFSKYSLSSIGIFLMLLAAVGYAASTSPVLVVIARILNGMGFSLCSVCMSTWMSDLLPKDRVGSGMGMYGAMNALASAVAPALGVSLYHKIGYRKTFLIAVVFAIVVLILLAFTENKGKPVERPERKRQKTRILEPKVIPIALLITLFLIPQCATQSFLVSYVEARQLPVKVSLYFPVFAIAMLLFRVIMKGEFDRWPFRRFFWICSVSALLSMGCLTATRGNTGMILAAIFMAGGGGLMYSVCQSASMLLAEPGERGVASSTYYMGQDLGMALGPFLGELLFDGLPVSQFYPALMLCVPAGILVYLIWQVSQRKTGKS